ncbi:MAG: hypothetical protein M5U08_26000 [Burkholderiales bacterium]|nr:hypothetical protein [Burkholderiales bacterium]
MTAPRLNQTNPAMAKTSETSARSAANSRSNEAKNEAKAYATPKITVSAVNDAPTTTQPRKGPVTSSRRRRHPRAALAGRLGSPPQRE